MLPPMVTRPEVVPTAAPVLAMLPGRLTAPVTLIGPAPVDTLVRLPVILFAPDRVPVPTPVVTMTRFPVPDIAPLRVTPVAAGANVRVWLLRVTAPLKVVVLVVLVMV